MLIFRAFDSPSPSSWWLRVFRSRHLVARGGIAIAIIMVLFVSACGYQSFCDRHHHGVFVLGRVLAGRFAIAIIMVVFSGSLACSVLSLKPFLAKCVRKWYHFY